MKSKSQLSMIFIVVFVDLLGFGILIPILPAFATKELGLGETSIGIVLASYSLVQFIFNPIFGGLSDKFGRRKIILYTLLINALGYVIFAFSHSLLMLLISRVVAGIGGSSIGVAQAYIADVTTSEERSKGMGLIGVAFALGFVFGPVLGGVLGHWGYEIVGLACAVTSLTAFSLSIFLLPEPDKKSREIVGRRKIFDFNQYKKTFSSTAVTVIILIFFVVTFSVANIYGTFALMGFKVFGFSDLQNGMVFAILGIVSAIIQGGFIGKLSKKFGDYYLIISGLLFMIFGLAMLPYGVNFTGIVIISVILTFGTGILQPVLLSLVSKVAKEEEQGFVLGANQSLSAIGRMLGPLWGGFSYEYFGYQVPFLTGAFCTFLLLIFVLFFIKNLIPNDLIFHRNSNV